MKKKLIIIEGNRFLRKQKYRLEQHSLNEDFMYFS